MPAVLADVIRKAPLTDEKVAFAWRTAVGPAFERVTTARLDATGVLHVTAADAQRETDELAALIDVRAFTAQERAWHKQLDAAMLEAIREAQAAGEIHTADEALALARRLHA